MATEAERNRRGRTAKQVRDAEFKDRVRAENVARGKDVTLAALGLFGNMLAARSAIMEGRMAATMSRLEADAAMMAIDQDLEHNLADISASSQASGFRSGGNVAALSAAAAGSAQRDRNVVNLQGTLAGLASMASAQGKSSAINLSGATAAAGAAHGERAETTVGRQMDLEDASAKQAHVGLRNSNQGMPKVQKPKDRGHQVQDAHRKRLNNNGWRDFRPGQPGRQS